MAAEPDIQSTDLQNPVQQTSMQIVADQADQAVLAVMQQHHSLVGVATFNSQDPCFYSAWPKPTWLGILLYMAVLMHALKADTSSWRNNRPGTVHNNRARIPMQNPTT